MLEKVFGLLNYNLEMTMRMHIEEDDEMRRLDD